jgi:hypothetical protein
MTADTCSPGIPGGAVSGASHDAGPRALPEVPAVPAMRCADSARMRDEPLKASAVRYSRFLLLEVPGPWGPSALEGTHMEAGTARELGRLAAAADTHVLLIRRPGRHPSALHSGEPRAWALADTSPGAERVVWGSWRDPAELLRLDLSAAAASDPAGPSGPQRLALVCTNGKRDQCCAVRGRPVAAAIADGTDWDTWECSHLGGHRFAATIMLLPTGDMFGWLNPESAIEVTRRFTAGQIMLSHYRGRCGQPVPVQAALHAAAVRLGDFNRDAIRVAWARCLPAGAGSHTTGQAPDDADRWEVQVIHQAGDGRETAYHLVMAGAKLAPTFLSCADGIRRAEDYYEALSFTQLGQPGKANHPISLRSRLIFL